MPRKRQSIPKDRSRTGAEMSVPRSVAEVLAEHVTLEVEGIDRMYLNVYIPGLQREQGVASFFRFHRGHQFASSALMDPISKPFEMEGVDRMFLNVYIPGLQREQGVASFFRFHRGHQFASSALMDPISKTFVSALEEYARREKIPVIQFRKGQRKDDIAAEQRKKFRKAEGVVFIGKAQEKTSVFRTERRRNEKTGATYPWLVRSTAMVNHFYIYCIDRDFGPFFLKFCTYFPYNAKLCLNGHEYAKRQLTNRGIGYEALDNGILSCADPKRVQALCDGLSGEKIDGLLRKWFRKLPHPFTGKDRQAGYRYQIPMLQ